MKSHKLIGPVLAAALAFSIGTAPVAAKGSNKPKIKPMATSNAAAKAPKVTTPKAKAPKANTVKVKSSTPKAKAPKANAPKVKSNTPKAKAPKAKTQTTSGINTPSNSNNPGNSNNSGNSSNSNNPGNSNDPGGTSNVSGQNKAQQHLAKNANLRAKLQSRLPPNTDINAAAAGFKNLGQFVAAVNVSHNHGIAFTDLKALMTGDHPLSLGQALQQLRGMDSNAANQVANPALNQANQEINVGKDRN